MKNKQINSWIRLGRLRKRQVDNERVKSILKSSENNVSVVKKIKITEKSATIVFREIYESIRQLGDAKWWLQGFETLSHDVSLEIVKEFDVKNKLKLNHLDRFRKIRNDINYRGFQVSLSQAKEIVDFWDKCGKEILNKLKSKVK